MIGYLIVFYLCLILLTIVVMRQNMKLERMKKIMEQERPIFLAMKVNGALETALKKSKDRDEFMRTIEQGFRN